MRFFRWPTRRILYFYSVSGVVGVILVIFCCAIAICNVKPDNTAENNDNTTVTTNNPDKMTLGIFLELYGST